MPSTSVSSVCRQDSVEVVEKEEDKSSQSLRKHQTQGHWLCLTGPGRRVKVGASSEEMFRSKVELGGGPEHLSLYYMLSPVRGKLLGHTQVDLMGKCGQLASCLPGKKDDRFRHHKSLYLWASGQPGDSCSFLNVSQGLCNLEIIDIFETCTFAFYIISFDVFFQKMTFR